MSGQPDRHAYAKLLEGKTYRWRQRSSIGSTSRGRPVINRVRSGGKIAVQRPCGAGLESQQESRLFVPIRIRPVFSKPGVELWSRLMSDLHSTAAWQSVHSHDRMSLDELW